MLESYEGEPNSVKLFPLPLISFHEAPEPEYEFESAASR